MTVLSRADASLVAENTFTGEIYVESNELVTLTITGTWAGTVTIQTQLFGSDAWIDIDSKTENGRWDIPAGGDNWRAGIKTGDYTSGTAVVTIQG